MLRLTAQIKEQIDRLIASQDGRWIACQIGLDWKLIDAINGTISPLSLPPVDGRDVFELAPNGQLIAGFTRSKDDLKLFVADAAGIRQIPIQAESYRYIDLCFTADSRYLWFTHTAVDGMAKLALLDTATLTIVNSVPRPRIKENRRDTERELKWYEVGMRLNADTDTLAVSHRDGDAMLGIYFFRHENQRILPAFSG